MNGVQYSIFNMIVPWFDLEIVQELKKLIEEKHLYQNIEINIADSAIILAQLKKDVGKDIERKYVFLLTRDFMEVYQLSFSLEWKLYRPSEPHHLPFGTPPSTDVEFVSPINLQPETVKIYCKTCERIEPYNYVDGIELLSDSREFRKLDHISTDQIFSLEYQCQSCKSLPEVFLVRRQGLKITLCGRSPIEYIDLPKYIPKKESTFISDAILAYNCGQLLPGIFLLRTFIEQFVRSKSKTPKSTNIDDLFTEYGSSLPDDFKQRIPSLKNIYDQLSIDIHNAASSDDTFINSKRDIYKHFDARRLYEII